LILRLSLLSLLASLLISGCWEEQEVETRRIITRSQGHFAGKPGDIVGPLEVQILGPAIRGVLGRSGFRDPVEGIEVKFGLDKPIRLANVPWPILLGKKPELDSNGRSASTGNPEHMPPTSAPPSISVVTDSSGYARAWVLLPEAIGEWRVEAEVEHELTRTIDVEFRITSGYKIFYTDQERTVGEKVQVAVQVFKIDEKKGVVPLENSHVWFQVDGKHNSRLGKGHMADRIKTNQEGVAEVDLHLGDRAGIYEVLASPFFEQLEESTETGGAAVEKPRVILLSPVILRGIAVNWTLVAVIVLGGGLLFLLGLRVLATGILNLLGPALTLPVTAFSQSRSRGFLGGLTAGAMFQSSSAVNSRLISFANGGLLTAAGALPIILGALLGRTLLPQVLAFPVGNASVVLLALGMVGIVLPRRLGVHAWGWVVLGTGLLIQGYWLIGNGLDTAKISESFREYLKGWDYSSASLPLGSRLWAFLSVLAFALSTGFILRSSNLIVAAAILLGNTGLISACVALPIVLGANLGPALTPLLTSLGRRREARRIALLQFLVLGIGGIWFVIFSLVTAEGNPLLLHLADAATPGRLFNPEPEHVGHHIAVIHTLFNLINLFILTISFRGKSLSRMLLRLTERAVPIPTDTVQEDIKPYHLDPNLIDVPALAILQATHEVTYLTELSRKAMAESFDAFRYGDLKLTEQTARREESISSIHRDITLYLLRVGENDLSYRESGRLQVLQATAGNLMRIGSLGERLRDLTVRAREEKLQLPEYVERDLNDIYDLVMGQFENVLQLLERPDGRTEENAVKLAERLAKFGSKVEHAWFEKLRQRDREGDLDTGETVGEEEAALLTGDSSSPTPGALEGEKKAGAQGEYLRLLIYHDALEVLFQVAGHLSHTAERMRVLSPMG